MNLAPLKRIRTRMVALAAARTVLPGLAAGLAVLAVAIFADAARGLVVGWRAAAVIAALSVVVLGCEGLRRALGARDLSLAGVARFAAARTSSGNATASYLESRESAGVPSYVSRRLEQAAVGELSAIEPSRVVALGALRTSIAAVLAATLVLLVPVARGYDVAGRFLRLRPDPVPADALAAAAAAVTAADVPDALTVIVTPPAYTGAAVATLANPVAIDAIAGSKIEVRVTPGSDGVVGSVSLNGAEPAAMESPTAGELVARFAADEGSVAVRTAGPAGPRANYLLPLSIRPDRAPEVHITSPKSDILVTASARPAQLAVDFEASDDFGLGRARLVYIRSIGEGDATEFVDGTLPVALSASSGGTARGRAVLDMAKLGVVAGATLVFHVEVEDRNAVAGPSTGMSESLVFEVAAPPPTTPITIGDLKPEELQRYLVSERMILEHTLKLEAQRKALERTEFLSRSTVIAGEQRDFKESFDQFIEIRDDEGHAHSDIAAFKSSKEYDKAKEEASNEAAAEKTDANAKAEEAQEHSIEAKTEGHAHGAVESTGMTDPARELLLAVRAMWDAERSLGIGETDVAIPFERAAIDHLKRAQRAIRYFPRVKVQTKPIDLKRRYSGELADIRSRLERLQRAEAAPDEKGLRDALAVITALCAEATSLDAESSPAARASDLETRAEAASSALLALHTGYDPAVVGVAGRLSNASASARRLAVARDAGDVGRARSALVGLGDDLFGAASQLGALLDRRGYVRGVSVAAPAGASSRSRAAVYARRLAGTDR